MNIFGVGPMEMGIIAVAALLIFGPGRLPEVMGQAGKAVRDFRRMTAELTGEFEKTIAEAKDIGQSVTGDIGAMKSEVASVTESVKRDLSGSSVKAGKTATASSSKTATGVTPKKTTEVSRKAPANGRSSSSTTKTSTNASPSASPSSQAAAPKTHANTATGAAEPIVVASKDDPASDFSLFATEPEIRQRRVRRAVPAAFAVEPDAADGTSPPAWEAAAPAPRAINGDDPLNRARQRRLAAGYTRRSA